MSFIFTASGAVQTTQTLASNELGFIGTLGALVVESADAIDVTGAGADIVNHGVIHSGANAIDADADFELFNSGRISSSSVTILMQDAADTVLTARITNSGEIVSLGNIAIQAGDDGLRLSNSGLIGGASSAISINVSGELSTINVIANAGVIMTSSTSASAIASSGRLQLVNTGQIIGGVFCSEGNDVIDNRLGTITGTVNLRAGNDLFRGGAGDETVTTTEGNNTIRGGGGDDTLSGSIGQDLIAGGSGDDSLSGSGGNDTVLGGAGDDVVNGGGSSDVLEGGAGNDTLIGDQGQDTMSGGNGADRFVFALPGHSAASFPDQIGDFTRGEDVIDLSALTAGELVFAGTGGFVGGGSASVIYARSGGFLTVSADTDGDGDADMVLIVFGESKLTASDFIL